MIERLIDKIKEIDDKEVFDRWNGITGLYDPILKRKNQKKGRKFIEHLSSLRNASRLAINCREELVKPAVLLRYMRIFKKLK